MTSHVVYAMSNTELHRVQNESVQLCVTSPPYVTTEFKRSQEFNYDEFMQEFHHVCEHIHRVCVPGGRFALNVADIITKYRYSDEDTISRIPFGPDCLQVAYSVGFRLLERFIWDKGFTRNFGGPLLGSYPYPMSLFNNNYFEYVYIFRKIGKRKVPQSVREASRISQGEWRKWVQEWWRIESISERVSFHRAVFPLEIPNRLIRMFSFTGDTVLDPYLGTGATMIAAHLCGRNSVGFEISPDCESMIKRRIAMEIGGLFETAPKYTVVKD